jgi:hypothetical protein
MRHLHSPIDNMCTQSVSYNLQCVHANIPAATRKTQSWQQQLDAVSHFSGSRASLFRRLKLRLQVFFNPVWVSKTCSASCNAETASTEAADNVSRTYDKLDRWGEFDACGRVTQDGGNPTGPRELVHGKRESFQWGRAGRLAR